MVLKIKKARLLKNVALVLLGTLLLSFGTAVFIIPFGLVAGGVSGFSIIINLITKGALSVDFLITLLTWALFVLGIFTLGRAFALKTLLSTLVYPLGVSLFGRLAENGFFNLANSSYPQLAVLLSALFGGITIGTGCAVTFLGGGSTGGVDIIAFSLCKASKKLKSSAVLFVIDATAVALGAFTIGDIVLTLLGIIAAFTSAIAVDKIFLGSSGAFVAQIVSTNPDGICSAVINRLHRTATIIDVVGGYSKKPKKLISVSFTYTQYSELMRLISALDPAAFVTVQKAHKIGGEGWNPLP